MKKTPAPGTSTGNSPDSVCVIAASVVAQDRILVPGYWRLAHHFKRILTVVGKANRTIG